MADCAPSPEMLSPHFSREEFEASPTASRKGLKNRMSAAQVLTARALLAACVEPVRAVTGALVTNSGFRSGPVNAAVGGSPTSEHTKGGAIDVETAALVGQGGLSTTELFDLVRLLGVPFDQLILEYPTKDPRGGWVHIGYRGTKSRGQVLLASSRGYTRYTKAPVLTDGIKALVAAFQASKGLEPDGIPGPNTRRALGISA